ncbi:OmpA family protein [Hymenobacter sp. DG25A]|uniref:OmpA family protein n=1 Tax=Hymenobacter sp. DG25A TaxID=1385663 RepID=UPI0006BC9D3C|nr:OmpA family protein [Hymenobacter sp. DG25A]ALD21891.1 hypothetical protein AM218_12605 [Hymenobacter sp. DG25A]
MYKSILTAAAMVAVLSSCDNMKNKAEHDELTEASTDTAVVARTGETAGAAMSDTVDADNWDVDANMPDVTTYTEVKNPKVKVRANDTYKVYDVDETVLFDTDKATLRASAKDALEEVAGSIKQRFSGKKVRVVGYTDARAGQEYNKDLGRERAEAVKNWLVQNGNIAAENIAVQSMGEKEPTASNATAAGRQQNRRVEIVVATK